MSILSLLSLLFAGGLRCSFLLLLPSLLLVALLPCHDGLLPSETISPSKHFYKLPWLWYFIIATESDYYRMETLYPLVRPVLLWID